MKHIISLFLFMSILTNSNLFAQSFCTTPSNIPDVLQTIPQNQFQQASFGHDVVRIFVHIMRRTDGTGGQTYEEVDIALNFLYSDFDEHNICFDLVGWDEIKDDALYNGVTFSSLAAYMDASRIDLFLFANDKLNLGQANGIPGNALRIGGSAFGSNLVTSHVISHEMGHCLGLYHTFHGLCEGGCAELVIGSNCTTCGDFVCDTPPDPQTFQVSQSTCLWNGNTCGVGANDANGDPYNPATNLVMAYIDPVCMQIHTAGQGIRMKDMIANSALLQATLGTSDPTVLYMKDNPNDFGIEPNPKGSINPSRRFWTSRDMWIRNVDDNGTVHQNPEHTNISPIWVYVRVRNKGCQASSGTEELKTYWTKSSIALWDWPSSWDNYFYDFGCGNFLTGDAIGTATIPVLNPGESTIIKFPWFAPDPLNFCESQSHVCLAARIETSPTSPFGMTFPEGNIIFSNTKNNNKIIWKNVTVVDDISGNKTGLLVGNVFGVPRSYNFIFQVPDEELNEPFTADGMVTIDLGQKIYEKWARGGKKGSGFVEEAQFNHMSVSGIKHHHSPKQFPNTPSLYNIMITSTDAVLENIQFEPQELININVRFNYNAQPDGVTKKEFKYDIMVAATEDGTILAGVLYEIDRPECQLPDAGSDVTILNKGTTVLSAAPIIQDAVYTWRDDKTGFIVGTGLTLNVSPNSTTSYELELLNPNGCIDFDVVTVTVQKKPPMERIRINPNPAKDHITAKCDLQNAQTARIEIRDAITGLLEKQLQLDVTKENFPIWVGDLPLGAHSCFLYTDNVLVGNEQLIIIQ